MQNRNVFQDKCKTVIVFKIKAKSSLNIFKLKGMLDFEVQRLKDPLYYDILKNPKVKVLEFTPFEDLNLKNALARQAP